MGLRGSNQRYVDELRPGNGLFAFISRGGAPCVRHIAVERFGGWELEHLDLDDARLKEIGAVGLEQPLKLSIKDHEGGGAGKIIQWDGEKWNVVSNGWVKSDRDLLLPLIYERADAYAKEKGITPRPDATN